MGKDGGHAIVAGEPPTEEELAEMIRVYQENIRKSPLYTMMVEAYDKETADELLKECRVELR
jgi:hypothetical protein